MIAYKDQLQVEGIVDKLSNGDRVTFTFNDPDLTVEVSAESCGYFLNFSLYGDGMCWSRHCSTAYEVSCELCDAMLGVWE